LSKEEEIHSKKKMRAFWRNKKKEKRKNRERKNIDQVAKAIPNIGDGYSIRTNSY
jgi:hypothetical protein